MPSRSETGDLSPTPDPGVSASDISPYVESNPGAATAAAIDAATVILVRDATDDRHGGVELLMIQRVGRGAFGGFWVFPGGKVDPDDRVTVSDIALASELATARAAAAREALEETGLVVDSCAMAPLSHWMPPPTEARRFSTWFFVAPAPQGEITLSLGEATEHRWITPEAAMGLPASEFPLAPPTWMSLRQLSGARSVDALMNSLRTATPPRMHTRVIAREPLTLAWAGDVAYEQVDEALNGDAPGPRHRLAMHKSGWIFEQG